MKKILLLFFGFLCIFAANAAQVANVEYVHTLIEQEWDISIPYNSALSDVHTVANMKYLLTAIDVANEILNGEKTTNYGNGEFATLQVADTIATNQAVETLIEKEEKYKFFVTIDQNLFPMGRKSFFGFEISAAGTFYIDWGDGTEETIVKNNTDKVEYLHDYGTKDAVYTIKIGGRATMYLQDYSAIHFGGGSGFTSSDDNAKIISQIDGSLGKIFRTLPDGSQPTFMSTFDHASNLKTIPAGLFSGIYGAPVSNMFNHTFAWCHNLTSIPARLFSGISGAPAKNMFLGTFSDCLSLTSIPDGLFAGISGAPASYMFSGTFQGCSKLTSIPAGLFVGISGAPAESMFNSTFSGCSGLTGAIPDGLFGNLTGAPASNMFLGTFQDCSKLTSIPENLFGNISGTAQDYMFKNTFYNCTSLTGTSARINGQYLYEIWPDANSDQVGGMYKNATGLSDYSNIPSAWK
ncbi:MAG: hypothetical protein IJN91_01150 [Alphaproteobacteria bacterium]|nr:hypothetical protein [Alphaproteobacteria bacterium]